MNKKELWLKLKGYHFEHVVPLNLWNHITEVFGGADGSTKAFANKIARKSGWKYAFALRAIAEYKKFVYLGVVSDFNVTPSKIIDQVWHEHLLFSKAYREFCSEVIEYTFDHNPELIPMTDQTGTFNIQYLDTIALYKNEFGINPPADIWSQPKFDQKKVVTEGFESTKKRNEFASAGDTFYSDEPLVFFLVVRSMKAVLLKPLTNSGALAAETPGAVVQVVSGVQTTQIQPHQVIATGTVAALIRVVMAALPAAAAVAVAAVVVAIEA